MNCKNYLPEKWTLSTIGEVTQPIEKVFPQENPNKEFLYIDISSIDNKLNKIINPKKYFGYNAPSRARQLVKTNDIVFSTVRTYLRNIALIPAEINNQIASTGFSILRANEIVIPKFLFFFSLSNEFVEKLGKMQRGTSYPAVRDADVKAQEIPVPPIEEQEQIVSKIEELFSQLDAGVAGLKRVQELLKQYRASVLKAGIEGKILKKPLENKKWLLIKSGDLFTWANGKALTQKELQKGNIPVFGGNGINGYHHESLMNFPTLIVGRVGVFCGNIFITSSPSWVTDNAIYAKSISEEISLKFSEMIFKSENLNKKASGSGQPFINQRILNEIEINLPSLGDQKFIVDETERQFSIVQQAEQVVKACLGQTLRLRQTILKLAFEGKLS